MKWIKRAALAGAAMLFAALAFPALDFALVDPCEAHYGNCSGFRAFVTDADRWLALVDRTDDWAPRERQKATPAPQGRDV